MASTFTTSLKFNKPALGDAGWGTAINGGFTDLVDQALGGQASIDVGSGPGPFVLTIPDGASGDARNMFIRATGTPGGAREIQVPTNRKLYFVTNDSDGAVTVKVSGQTGVVVPVGASVALRINAAGTDVAPALTYQASMTLGTALAATSGGTGQSSYAVGDLLYAGTTTTLAKLASVATGNVLRAGGVGAAPAWGQVGLTTDVTGVLPVANGGTGAATLTGLTVGNGTGALTSLGASIADAYKIARLVPIDLYTAEWRSENIGASTAQVQAGLTSNFFVTPESLRGGALVSGTAQATTSGTVKDFTDIPSWVKRITVMFLDVSTNGTSNLLIQIGGIGGIVTTGYKSGAQIPGGIVTSTSGYITTNSVGATSVMQGTITLTNINANAWMMTGLTYQSTGVVASSAGSVILATVLTQIRITTVNGADTFDAGSVNIMYE